MTPIWVVLLRIVYHKRTITEEYEPRSIHDAPWSNRNDDKDQEMLTQLRFQVRRPLLKN